MPRSDVDIGLAAQFLERRFGVAATAPRQLRGGEWSSAYGYRFEGSEWVIRFSRYREDLAKDEYAASYASAKLPIPSVVERDSLPANNGAQGRVWYAITPFITGNFLEELDQPAFRRTLPATVELIAAMTAADTSSTTGFGPWNEHGQGQYPSWPSYLLDVARDDASLRTSGWSRALANNPAASRTFERALAALRSRADTCPDQRHLVHNDLLHRNVFVQDDEIVGVIDWANSLYGDPLYDVAILAFWAPWYPAIDESAVLDAARSRLAISATDVAERLLTYQLHIGLEHIAYNAATRPHDNTDMTAVCKRTEHVLSRL